MRWTPLFQINAFSVAFAAGIFCAPHVSQIFMAIYGAIVLLLCCAVFCVCRDRRAEPVILLLFFLLGAMRSLHAEAIPTSDVGRLIGQFVAIEGRVADTPRFYDMEGGKVRARYVVEVERASQNDKRFAASGKILIGVTVEPGMPRARYGDRIRATGTPQALHGYRNPGMVDSAEILRRRGIAARLRVEEATVTPVENGGLLRTVDELRANLLARMEAVMSKEDAAVLFGMLFGGYADIRPQLVEAFTATGIVHILSVSGSHVTLLAAALQWLGKLVGASRALTALLIAAAALTYTVFSGCVPPAVRAALMGTLAFAAPALRRESDARYLLALVAFGMLIFDPQLLWEIGFQLSFGCTAGLLYLASPLARGLAFLPAWLAESFAMTTAAQLAVLPLLAWYFNTVSLSALLANLLVVPILEWTIMGTLLAALAGIYLPFLQKILFVFGSLSVGFVYTATRILAQIPGGAMVLPSGSPFFGVAYYAVLTAALYWRETFFACTAKICNRHFAPVLAVCGIAICCFVYFHPGEMQVHFIDVGQGDAMLLVTPNGRAVMVDTGGILDLGSGGGFDVGARVVAPYLRHYGVSELDYLILTHAHADHAGGAAAVRKSFPVRHVIVGRENRLEYAKTLHTSIENCASFIPAYEGQSILLDGVRLDIVYAGEQSGNEASSVVSVSYGAHRFLLTGDLEADGERNIIQSGKNVASMVLKVGHHGSKTSSSEEFLAAVRPRCAVISVGADNRFGHPNAETLDRLRVIGARVFRTDEMGAVVFYSDGARLRAETYINRK